MFFKVDYDKVSETSSILKQKSEELNTLYFEIVDLCKSIDENWQSEDSTVYLAQLLSFLRERIQENEKLNNAGSVLKNVSSRYAEQDAKWEKELIQNDIMKG